MINIMKHIVLSLVFAIITNTSMIICATLLILFSTAILMMFIGPEVGQQFVDIANQTIALFYNNNKILFGWLCLIPGYFMAQQFLKLVTKLN